MYLTPNITDEDVKRLRNGEALADKLVSAISFRYTTINEKGDRVWHRSHIEVAARDYITDFVQIRPVFFGDRPLDNPGYSAIVLKGEVKTGSTDRLDVLKVEQRLKYLGFPAMGTAAGNSIKNFKVDGTFAAEESAALKLFEKTVRYQNSAPSSRFAEASPGADGVIEQVNQQLQNNVTLANLNANQGLKTINWLNAYNAPHWMELFGATNGIGNAHNAQMLPGWRSTQTGAEASDQVERFGTSWMRDLMLAKTKYAPTNLLTGIESRFNGITDANLVRTPRLHSSHDLGMTLDLGIGYYVNVDSQRRVSESLIPEVTTTALTDVQRANRWSDTNAAQLAGLLTARGTRPFTAAQQTQLTATVNQRQFIDPESNINVWQGINDQRFALLDFSAMYSLTQDTGGSWRNIVLQNTDNAQNDIRRGLFGGGDKDSGLISKVLVGDAAWTDRRTGVFHPLDRNPLTNIVNAIRRLGVDVGAANAHENHFHVYLRPPAPIKIGGGTSQLLATEAAQLPLDSEFKAKTIPAWLSNPTDSDIELLEDFSMFTLDIPDAYPQAQVVWMAQATVPAQKTLPGEYNYNAQSDTKAAGTKPDMTLVACQPPGSNIFSPEVAVENYFYLKFKHRLDTDNAKVELIEPTKKAPLSYYQNKEERKTGWAYEGSTKVTEGVSNRPHGVDQATFLVTIKNLSTGKWMNIRIIEQIGLTSIWPKNSHKYAEEDCGPIRKISANGSSTNLAAWQRSANLSTLITSAQQTLTGFADLPATALGQTTGEGLTAQITLDQNAAGHNWYIDPTPLDNSDDYLPTSDASVWQAKAGSEAAGKMDMLSVLLHEYGHALGLEHSGAASDFMAASLQPGVRKLPSAAELTLMSQLVAELKGAAGDALPPTLSQWETEQDPSNPFAPSPLSALGLLPFGLMRRNDSKGAANAALTAGAATPTSYLTAINTTLANGSFSARQNGIIDQWESVGNVAATPAVAFHAVTLGESTTAQAHLAQAFVLSAQDRFLTFTISGLNLQSNSTQQNGVFTAAPQDAFEVALQNANTGTNLLANGPENLGTSHSDALLNVQLASSNAAATLQERAVSGLRHTDNAGGSRTYVLDLSGIAAGTAVNLSFDLIGFGLSASQLGSKVNISDVRLISTPVAVNDTATLAEDGSTTLTVQANDLNAEAAGFAPRLVASARHGQVSINLNVNAANGVFSGFVYTPDANFFGTDSFTYQYSNAAGTELSNTATVNLTVTPVNDAPVAADVTVSTAEDTVLAINLVATDADNTWAELVFSIQNQPAYGSLVRNADGGYGYTPDGNYFGADRSGAGCLNNFPRFTSGLRSDRERCISCPRRRFVACVERAAAVRAARGESGISF